MATADARRRHGRRWSPRSGAYLAVVLVCGLGVSLLVLPDTPPTACPPDGFHPVPPAIARHRLPDPAGPGRDDDTFTLAFDAAIAPWQAGNYVEAALRLDALARVFPTDADAHFYRGTAWLLAGVATDAVSPLQRAVALAPPSLAPEAAWYLGLALREVGRADEARRSLADACRWGHRQACRAAATRARCHATAVGQYACTSTPGTRLK